MLERLGPHFEQIETELGGLTELREKPAGTIRITAGEHAAYAVLWPVLAEFPPHYPDIKVEVIVDYGLTDIVAQRYDAGVRLGEQVAKDMIAVRIGPDMRMAVVGAPSYFAQRSPPKKPQDLTTHNCINLRLPTHGGLYAWELEKGRRELHVRVDGQLIFNNIALRINAVLEGLGLAFLPEDAVQPYLTQGRLSRVLEDWCPPSSGYHLFTPVGGRPRPPLGYWWTRSDIAEPSPDGGARQKRSQRMTASSKIVAARECLLLGPKRRYRRSAFWTDTGCITCEDRDLRPLGAVHLPCKYV